MKFPDYAKCQPRSIYMAKEIEKLGFRPSVLYGIYTPSRPRSTWDERWQSASGSEFTHFWVCVEQLFLDYSCFQFGETSPIKTNRGDSRYTELGFYDWRTETLTNTGNLMIEWDSLTEKDGVPVLRLVPIFV